MLWSAAMTTGGRLGRVGWYTAREVLLPAAGAVVVTTFLLLTTQILRIGQAAFGYGLTAGDFAEILLLLLPRFIVFTLPIATLVGVVAGLGRLAGDREILALEGAGLSPARLWPGPVVLGLTASLVALSLTTVGEPAALRALSNRLAHVIEKNLAEGLTPGVIHDRIPGLMIRAARRKPDGTLGDVVLELRTSDTALTIAARRARLTPATHQHLRLAAEDGEILEETPGGEGAAPTLTRTRFARGTLNLDVSFAVQHRVKFIGALDTLSSGALYRRARAEHEPAKRRKMWMLFNRRLALPFACLALAILGMPIGLAGNRRRAPRRGMAFVAGLSVVVAYYVLLRLGEAWSLSGALPEALAAWIPNAVAMLTGGWFLWRRTSR